MKFNAGPLAGWFGHTRRERRSSCILLAIILIVLAVRYLVPERNLEAVDISALVPSHLSEKNVPDKNYSKASMLQGGKGISKAGQRADSGRASRSAGRSIPRDSAGRRYAGGGRGTGLKPPVDLNRCDSAELERLPGIGPVLSGRIIKYRKFLGGFASAGQLGEVYGLPPETLDVIRGMVTANPEDVTQVDINSAGFRELSRVRYLDKYEISSILKFRELNGPIPGIGALTENRILSVEKAGKVKPYLKFRQH